MSQPNGFLVILPGQIIEIPQDSYLSWLTLFYALPKELVQKRPAYLSVPRNIHVLLKDKKCRDLIQNDAFLELVWDCYAWGIWQFLQVPYEKGGYHDIPGDWQDYSGDFPLWRLSYDIIRYFRMKFEGPMEWSFQNLFMMSEEEEVPWLSYRHFNNLLGNLTDMIVEEQKLQPVIDAAWKNRQPEDYNGRNTQQRDFERSWNHSRTAKHLSLEQISEEGITINGDDLYDIPDPSAEFETKLISEERMEKFKATLNEKQRQTLELYAAGLTQQMIADRLGDKTTGAVSKRVQKIAALYSEFIEREYGEFLNKHVKE